MNVIITEIVDLGSDAPADAGKSFFAIDGQLLEGVLCCTKRGQPIQKGAESCGSRCSTRIRKSLNFQNFFPLKK